MEVKEQLDNSNDFAVAKELNRAIRSLVLIVLVRSSAGMDHEEDNDEINRAYILISNELEELYSRNLKLSEIKPEPFWKVFDVIKTATWDILDYLDYPKNDIGEAHIARIEKLCIIANASKPIFTPKQKELIDQVNTEFEERITLAVNTHNENKERAKANRAIEMYTLTYKSDGTILVNDVLKLKKVHAGSTTERLLEQAVKSPNELFNPDLGQTARNLSTVLSSAGFTSTLRQLFFPIVSNSKGIVFRPTVSRALADKDNIDTSELDRTLRLLVSS